MTVRAQLVALGVPEYRVPLATPYMFFAPMTVDRRAAGVREIVSGLQRRLRDIGFGVADSGVIDVATTRALDRLVPPSGSFAARSFSELASILLTASATAAQTRSALSGATWKPGRDKTNCVGLGPTKATFIHLQRGLNRVATKLGTPRVGTDGIIGKSTVRAAKAVMATVYHTLPERWQTATCVMLANRAGEIGAALHKKADLLGAPKNVKGSRPSPRPKGLDPTTPNVASPRSGTETLLKFAPFVLLAGGVAFVAIKMRSEHA